MVCSIKRQPAKGRDSSQKNLKIESRKSKKTKNGVLLVLILIHMKKLKLIQNQNSRNL